jgi:hypothetical protein
VPYALVSTCPLPSPYPGSVLATALAWALAMVVIFVGVDLATSGGLGRETVVILTITLGCSRAVVGVCTA